MASYDGLASSPASGQADKSPTLSVGTLVRVIVPERDSLRHRVPSDIGEVQEVSDAGIYSVKLLGHPATDMSQYTRQDLEVRKMHCCS